MLDIEPTTQPTPISTRKNPERHQVIVKKKTYTATCVVYTLLDLTLNEALPGPAGSRTLVESARRTKVLEDVA